MFMNIYISLSNEDVLVILGIALALLVLAYIILVIVSFSFMLNFKKDINRRKDFINVTLYQKCDLLIKLSYIMDPYLKESDPLKIFAQNDELKTYQRLEANEFEEFYNYTEKMLQKCQSIYINYDLKDKKTSVEEIFLTIGELNEKYFQTVQLYNTSVVGYNYRYNFFSTKWIKKIFFIKKIDTIK